jgi:5'/3'-nucleotidase SurE
MNRTTLSSIVLAVAAAASSNALALNVVLGNDDGWDAPGIQAMKGALVAAGHSVVLSAPADEQSGSSGALNFDTLQVVKHRGFADEGALEYSVALFGTGEGAEPATSAMVGVGIAAPLFGGPPDVLISGINSGQNLGAAAQISGTVGAAAAAISSVSGGAQIPAIAISTDEPCGEPACEAENEANYGRVADFVVRLLGELEAVAGDGPLMPAGIGLNINHPPLEQVAGAVVARQGRTFNIPGVGAISLGFGCYADCLGAPVGTPVPAGLTGAAPISVEEAAAADTAANADGFITVVPVAPDYTAGLWKASNAEVRNFRSQLEKVLRQIGY